MRQRKFHLNNGVRMFQNANGVQCVKTIVRTMMPGIIFLLIMRMHAHTVVSDNNKYFDVYITYAKHSKKDIAIRIEIINRGNTTAPITVLPTLWFYNRWQYGGIDKKPVIREVNDFTVKATHERLGSYYL